MNEVSNGLISSSLYKIVKDNRLVQSKYSLEQTEQKLLYKIIEYVQVNNFQTKRVTIRYEDFKNEYKGIIKKNITKKDFIHLIESLQNKIPKILVNNEYMRIPWYHLIEDKNYNYVILDIPDIIFAYIHNLSQQFTMLSLSSLYSFKRFYSMRFYEIFKQWSRDKKEVSIPYKLSHLKELLELDEKTAYNRFSNFKAKVLEPSIQEINEKSELSVSYTVIKNGRSIDGINFTVHDDGIMTIPNVTQENKEKQQVHTTKENFPVNNLKFNNFTPRTYDYEVLEKQLLGWDTPDSE